MIYKECTIIIEALRFLRKDKADHKTELQVRKEEILKDGMPPESERVIRAIDQEIQTVSKEIVSINNIIAKIHNMQFS